MYIKYGNYSHQPWEANLLSLTVRPRMNARGFRVSNVATAHVGGELCMADGETQYDLSTRIQALSDAFSVDGLDWGLYHDNNTATPHFLSSTHVDSLTGNQIIYKAFPASHGGEYTSGREFAYAVRNEFRAAQTLLLSYRESITHIGTTGPQIVWRNNRSYGPTFHLEAPATYQTIVQEGQAETLLTYFLPTAPILSTPFEDETQRRIQRIGPRRFPRGYESYIVRWRYMFYTPTIYPTFPNLR